MIRKLRLKFVIILMSVVTLILLAVFISMLLSTSGNTRRISENMLEQALDMQPPPQGSRPPQAERGPNPVRKAPPAPRLAILVAEIDSNGRISFLTNQLHFIEDDQALSAVKTVLNTDETRGVLDDYKLRWLKSEDGTRIALADISMEQEMLKNLIINSLLIGSTALVVFFLVSLLLARWAVRPVEIAWDRQKQFIADASHELKTPLTVILSNADMLGADNTIADKKAAHRVEHIKAEAIQMKKLVEDMLVLAKTDSLEKVTFLSKLDFSYVATNVILMYEPVIYDEKKELVFQVQDGLMVMGDSEGLQQLMHILLDNARKYCPEEGSIRIDLKESERGRAVLKVFNEGAPIPQTELDKIFLRFYRRDESRSEHGSFGLGLAIASSIVKTHKGKIWADSQAESGNTFYVSLPLA